MTAPAEDSRGGEVCKGTHPHLSPENYCHEPVGHGGQHMAHDDEGRPEYVWTTGDVWDWAPDPAARPAGDRAQPTEEPSSNDVAVEDVRAIAVALGLGGHARPYSAHDVVRREILPAVAALLDAQAKVERVEAAIRMLADVAKSIEYDVCHSEPSQFKANELGKAMGYRRSARDLRRALDGA